MLVAAGQFAVTSVWEKNAEICALPILLEYSDRCLVVVEGKIIADDNPVTILNQKDLLESANLKQTSLYTLGQKLSSDPVEVTQYYIEKGGPNV